MFSLKVPTKQLDQVKGMLALVPNRMNYGLKLMLNVLAEDVGKAQTALLGSSIDRPTPYTMKAVRVKGATEKDLTALVWLKDPYAKNTTRMTDTHYLEPLIHGGDRPRKGFESYLRHSGRQFFSMASNDYPLNQYGNVTPGKMTQIISQLKQFEETGFDANRRGVSKIFAVWDIGYSGGLLPGIYERYDDARKAKQAGRYLLARALIKKGKIKGGLTELNRRTRALYPRGVKPIMMMSTRAYTYKKQIPWHESAQSTVNTNADKAAAIAIKYALGRG